MIIFCFCSKGATRCRLSNNKIIYSLRPGILHAVGGG